MDQVDKILNDCTTFLVRENRFFWSSSSRYILQKNYEMEIKQNSYQSLIMKELRMHPSFDELCRFLKRGTSASPRNRQRWRPRVVLFLRIQWLENPIRQNIMTKVYEIHFKMGLLDLRYRTKAGERVSNSCPIRSTFALLTSYTSD
jgi:hypothetical protein